MMTFLVQLISPTIGWSFKLSLYAKLNCRIFHRFWTENPCIPGNSFCRSFARVSTIAFPQPSSSCFATIDLPMSQYRFMSSLFTALRASYWALYIRSLISLRNDLYSAVITTDISSPLFNDCCYLILFFLYLEP